MGGAKLMFCCPSFQGLWRAMLESSAIMAAADLTTQVPLATADPSNLTQVDSILLCHELLGDARKICYMEKGGYGIIVPSVSFVGIFFNILNLVVLRSRKLKESTYTYLTGLAIADGLSLVFFGVNSIGRGHYPDSYRWRVFEVYLYWPIGTITTVASVMLTVTVTVERFIFIYRPYRARTWCVPRVAQRVTLVVFALCAVCNIPRFFVFAINPTSFALEYTSFAQTPFYIAYSWMHFLVISVGSALLLIVFNILLLLGIHRTHRRRHYMISRHSAAAARERKDETRLTKTLVAVIFLFIVGEIPSALCSRSIVVGIIGSGDTTILQSFGYKVAVLVSTILVVNQHSLNFVIYCVFNRKFWAVFKRKLCPCIAKRVKSNDTSLCSQMALPMDNASPNRDNSFQSAWGSAH